MLFNFLHLKKIIVLIVISVAVIFFTTCSGMPGNARQEDLPFMETPGEDVFLKIPAILREYLKQLAYAFENHNNKFLIAQGEENYAKDLRGSKSEGQYLALLYRVGPYATDSTWQIPEYRLDLDSVKRVNWVNYSEKGPILDIEGIITDNSGKSIPCRLMLLWRLPIPKILGAYP